MIMRRLTATWEGLVEPAWAGGARDRRSSLILNIILLLLLLWAVVFEIQYRADNPQPGGGDILVLTLTGLLILTFSLNRRGQFSAAVLLTLVVFVASSFVSALFQHWRGSANLPVLYYLVIPILISEQFFSMKGYLIAIALILAGILGLSLLNPAAGAPAAHPP